MAGRFGKQFEILELNAAVSLAKRVDVVHISDDPTGFGRKGRPIERLQIIAALKPPMDVGHTGFDVSAKLKLLPAFRELDAAKFARPFKDVPKQMTMNGAQVSEVEPAGWHAFRDALRNKEALHAVELRRIGKTKLVSQHRRTRIEIRIDVAHSAARAVICARI